MTEHPQAAEQAPRALTRRLRLLYGCAAALAVGAAVLTYVLTERTDEFFAWAIEPSLSAAFIGASYCAAATLLILASRPQPWVRGRLAAVPVFTISLLLLAATVIHWDRFEHGHAVFWLWLTAYVLVPPVLIVLVRDQLRKPGADPRSDVPIPALARAGLVAQAAIMLGLGAFLFVLPEVAEDVWPWPLSPLTSRALGAFIVGFGAIAAFVARDNRLAGLRDAAVAYAVLGLAQLVAVLRYSGDLDFNGAAAWIYVAFLATVLLGGLAIAGLARTHPAS